MSGTAGYHEVLYDDGDQYKGDWNADGKVFILARPPVRQQTSGLYGHAPPPRAPSVPPQSLFRGVGAPLTDPPPPPPRASHGADAALGHRAA